LVLEKKIFKGNAFFGTFWHILAFLKKKFFCPKKVSNKYYSQYRGANMKCTFLKFPTPLGTVPGYKTFGKLKYIDYSTNKHMKF
jgi:hypothetical protein